MLRRSFQASVRRSLYSCTPLLASRNDNVDGRNSPPRPNENHGRIVPTRHNQLHNNGLNYNQQGTATRTRGRSFSSSWASIRNHSSSAAAMEPNQDDDGAEMSSGGSSGSKVVVPFLLADIGEGIRDVEVLQWYVQVGDTVQEFDSICQVQSDKATVDITSRFAGKIVDISPDTTILVGQPLVHIETVGSSTEEERPPTSGSKPSPSSKAPPPEPVASDERNQPSGRVLNGFESSNDNIGANNRTPSSNSDKYLASPAVRKLAADHGIDLRSFQGTGPQGRILKGDILSHVGAAPTTAFTPEHPQPNQHPSAAPESASIQNNKPTPTVDDSSGSSRIVTLSGYNRAMVQSMTESLQIPHMCLGDEIVVDKLIQFRKEWNSSIDATAGEQEAGQDSTPKLGMQTLLIKACSLALKEFPSVNAKIHDADKYQVCYHNDHDIGVAMDTPHGLVVPVIRQVQKKSLVELQRDLDRLKQAASTGRTSMDDLVPSPTFTLSNIGAIGVGTHMSPVLVPPMIAMGALGRIQRLPRFVSSDDNENGDFADKENVVPTHLLYVSWAADHRFLDGATLARFHRAFAKYASNPLRMLPFLK